MPLKEEFEREGSWLFRWRSYLPFLILPFLVVALRDSEYLEKNFGYTAQTIWEVICIAVSFLGLLVRCVTIGWIAEGTSGRNTEQQKASQVNTEGMYSVTRHPLYLGNFLIIFGLILFVQVPWLVLAVTLVYFLYYERIMYAEEEFLRKKFGEPYVVWAEKVPAFFPDFRKWKTPTQKFSFKMILKREYTGFLGVIVGFVALKFFANLIGQHQLKMKMASIVFLGVGLIIYVILRYLRKHTKLLNRI